MSRPDDTNSQAAVTDSPPPMAGTHFDDQAERSPTPAPEDFPRGTGIGGHVEPDIPPHDALSADPEVNIIPSDSPGG